MLEFLFDTQGFTPHAESVALDPTVVRLHIVSGLMIELAYLAIPAMIVWVLAKRKDAKLTPLTLLLIGFIVVSASNHLMETLSLFFPIYGLEGMVKLATGVISLITAYAIWRLLPKLVAIPSPKRLIQIIDAREMEIAKREAAQEKQRKSEEALAKKVEELETTNKELKEFAYAASHDLKSPANTLTLWLDEFEIDHGEKLGRDGPEMLGEARQIVGRMRDLVEDILRYSRIVNTDPSRLECIEPMALMREVISDHAADLRAAGGAIDVKPMPEIRAQPRLISVLLQNLIGNSIKFRSLDRPLRIEVCGEITGGRRPHSVLAVRDNGIGIDPKDHEQIFSMFNRLHNHEIYEGLGLALCRRVAISHGGRIELTSSLDEGAEFRVYLPMEPSRAQQAA
ncbi:MAG: ATP-binding protein [Pseudomonadota bacterium]